MARLGPFGRGGRGGRSSTHYYKEPKYLQNPPPILRYKKPDFSTNPFTSLQNQFKEDSAFIQISQDQTNPTNPEIKANPNDNGLATFFNNRKSLRKKSNKKKLNVTYYDLQRHSISFPATATASPENSVTPQSNNIRPSSRNRLQSTPAPSSKNFPYQPQLNSTSQQTMPANANSITHVEAPNNNKLTAEDMEMPNAGTTNEVNIITQPDLNSAPQDATNVITTASNTTNDVMMKPPKTPKGRRSKKTKATSPPTTTPTKRGKGDNNLDPLDSPSKPDLTPDTLFPDTSDDELEKMTKESLISEVFQLAKKTGHACSEEAFKSLSTSVLLARAKEYKTSLLAKAKKSAKKPALIPIIKFDTADSMINELDGRKARAVFLSCLRKQNKKIERPKLDGMSLQDFKQEISTYRNSLLAQDMDFEIDDPTLTDTPLPPPTSE